jgi:CBS domain-containing protein
VQIREIMTTEVCCANPEDSLSKVAAEMKRHNVGVMPVCDGDKLIGMVTDRDIVVECAASGGDPKQCKARDAMTSELLGASPNMDVVDAVRKMSEEQLHRLPVVEGDKLVGMVSVGDIAVNCNDDRLIASMLRAISTPVRSRRIEQIAA